jgi:hypothetical protein
MTGPLPKIEEIRRSALEWAMSRRGGYTGDDLREHLSGYFNLTEEQLARARADGLLRFADLVDSVIAEFTEGRIHTGWNGRPHKNPTDLYFLTRYGYAVGERKAEWPTDGRKGAPNAKPDPRQLNEAQVGLATWIPPNATD